MKTTVSKLRASIYKMLDQVLETGVPVEINRKGKKLKIVPAAHVDKFQKLTRRKITHKSLESFVHLDWSHEWKE